MKLRQQYFTKSRDTWFQQLPETRLAYKIQLVHTRKKKHAQCNRCHKWFKIVRLTVDHIWPISKGGHVDDLGNMQLMCEHCHRIKTRLDKRG